MCLCVYRSNNTELVNRNLFNTFQEVNLGVIDCRGKGLLGAVEQTFSDIFIPAISNYKYWGIFRIIKTTKIGQNI